MYVSKQELTTNELLVLSSELRRHEKSLAIAYLMLLGGHLGVHRFYLKRTGTAITQLVLFLGAILLYFGFAVLEVLFPESLIPLIPLCLVFLCGGTLAVWMLVDLFLIPHMVREWNERTEHQLMHQLVALRRPPQNLN
ncbi:NINE protein [Paenibacillus pinistramenti]|uniref:NINE protein n=1 Tax=Paenibacillus pinistramenti TaxID=1768003 RepID=UPI001108C5C7|nr:NINE protein [Paenibacillus pinistramenti]